MRMCLSVDGRVTTLTGFGKETSSGRLTGESRSRGDVSCDDVLKDRGWIFGYSILVNGLDLDL